MTSTRMELGIRAVNKRGGPRGLLGPSRGFLELSLSFFGLLGPFSALSSFLWPSLAFSKPSPTLLRPSHEVSLTTLLGTHRRSWGGAGGALAPLWKN